MKKCCKKEIKKILEKVREKVIEELRLTITAQTLDTRQDLKEFLMEYKGIFNELLDDLWRPFAKELKKLKEEK